MSDNKQSNNAPVQTADTPVQVSYSDYNILTSKGYCMIVQCRKDDHPVILKALKPEHRSRVLLRNALKREFKQCQRLNHSGIIRYQGLVEVADYGLCIEEEFVEGRNLQAYLKEQHTDDEKVSIVNQIADALRYVHQLGMAHRNLKPSNILITSQGNKVKLIDFNVLSPDDVKPTADTMRYIAPELKDETMTADGTADIYSLGIIMKVMGLDLAYNDIIKRCCAFKRSDRYGSIDEFLADFNHEGSSFTMPTIGRGTIVVALCSVAVIVLGLLLYNFGGVLVDSAKNIDVASIFQSDKPVAPVDTVKPKPQAKKNTVKQENHVQNVGKLAFMNTMRPNLYRDLDRIFLEHSADRTKLNKAIKTYYRGLLQANDTLDMEQRAELDKVFGDYVQQKKASLK